MKTIVIYFNSMSPAGGIERVIANLANNWANKYEIIILTKDDKRSFYSLDKRIKLVSFNLSIKMDMNNKFSRILSTFFGMILVMFKLKKFIKNNNFNYIYIATPMNALEIYLASPKLLKKSIIAEHASYYGYNKVYNKIKTFIYPKAKIISTPTTMDNTIYNKLGYNSVYIPHLSTFPATKNISTQNIALNIGRLTSDKRQIELLKNWKTFKLIDKNNWKLIIIGKGELKNKILSFIDNNNLNDSVELLKPTDNIDDIYQKASLFLFSSRYEGFGMVLLEAMSFGLPCISYDIPSGPMDIINGRNGFLIPDDDTNEFVKKMVLLTTDKKLLLKMKEEAFLTAKNWNNNEILSSWEKEVFI